MSMQDFIPDGFVPLADWDFRERQKHDGHSVEWKTLSDAVKAGELPGFKLSNGRWYVHRAKAVELLAEEVPAAVLAETPAGKECADSAQQIEALVCALSALVTNQTTTLHAIERIADAVEQIAKQPLARLEDCGIVETNSNGFHN